MRILMLDLDTLRADHLGCYGYHRDTSPHIDQVAKDGICYQNYFCSDAPCLPSRVALMSGRFGIQTGAVNHGGVAADMRLEGKNRDMQDHLATESLPAVLRRAGFDTISISPFAERHSNWTFYAGFSEIYNTKKRGRESAEEISPTVFDWLNRRASEDNWFLHVNYWDAHTPYRAPESFGNPFETECLEPFYNEELVKKHKNSVGPHSPKELNMYDDKQKNDRPRAIGSFQDFVGMKSYIDGYDCGIKYMDEHLGRIFQLLKDKGIYEDTAIIITADHGENFGELNIYGEHATADRATCNIPMIVKWPKGRKHAVDTQLRYNLDLIPTLADMFGIEQSPRWSGQSFRSSLFEEAKEGRNELILSQCAHVCQRSVLFDDYLYIRTYHDGYHLYPKEMLFNLKEDPKEQHNIAKEFPDICKDAIYRYMNWHDEMMESMPYETDPLWVVMKENGPHHCRGKLKDYLKRLEQTDREEAASLLREKYPNEITDQYEI